MPDQPGLVAWARLRFGEQATWRELAYTGLLITVLWPMELLAVVYGIAGPLLAVYSPIALEESGEFRLLKFWLIDSYPEAFAAALLGAVLLALFIYPLTALAVLHGILARLLLGARETDEARRVIQVTRSRARLVDAFEVERRRIERDLHDGAQQRLVALTLTLGLARLDAARGRAAAARRAHEQAKQSLAETARVDPRRPPAGARPTGGCPPPSHDVADRSPVPVDVVRGPPGRLPRGGGHRVLRGLGGADERRPAQRARRAARRRRRRPTAVGAGDQRRRRGGADPPGHRPGRAGRPGRGGRTGRCAVQPARWTDPGAWEIPSRWHRPAVGG